MLINRILSSGERAEYLHAYNLAVDNGDSQLIDYYAAALLDDIYLREQLDVHQRYLSEHAHG